MVGKSRGARRHSGHEHYARTEFPSFVHGEKVIFRARLSLFLHIRYELKNDDNLL